MTGLVQTLAEATGSRALSPLIVSRDSYSPWILARIQTRRSMYIACSSRCSLISLITNICVIYFCDLTSLDVYLSSVSLWRLIYKFVFFFLFPNPSTSACMLIWKIKYFPSFELFSLNLNSTTWVFQRYVL